MSQASQVDRSKTNLPLKKRPQPRPPPLNMAFDNQQNNQTMCIKMIELENHIYRVSQKYFYLLANLNEIFYTLTIQSPCLNIAAQYDK